MAAQDTSNRDQKDKREAEAIVYIRSKCSELDQLEYKKRHNKVTEAAHGNLRET